MLNVWRHDDWQLQLATMNDHRKDCSAKNLRTTSHVKPTFRFLSGYEDADIAAKAGLDVAISNMRFPVSDLSTNCVLKNGNNCGTSVQVSKSLTGNHMLEMATSSPALAAMSASLAPWLVYDFPWWGDFTLKGWIQPFMKNFFNGNYEN